MKRIHIIAALTLALTLAIALNVSPYLRGPDSWRWAYALPGAPWRHLVPTGAVAGYVAAVVFAWHRLGLSAPALARRRARLGFVLFATVAAPLLQLALLYPDSPDVLRPLLYRTVSPGASGVFTVGSTIDDPGAFLRAYPALMPAFPVHPQRYPPGLPVLFYLARQALALAPGLAHRVGMTLRPYQCHDLTLMRLPNVTLATAALQMALPALAALVLFPLYTLARETVSERAALLAIGLYPLVPSFALWSARWDQAYPLLACAVWACFALGLRRSRWGWMLAAGLCLSAASFLSFGMIVLLMPLGLWALLHAASGEAGWSGLWTAARGPYPRLAATFFAGLVLPWLAYQLAFGSGFVEIWRVSMSFHLGLARDYWVWLAYHPYDFFLFLGIPLAALFLTAVHGARLRARGTAFIWTVALSLLLLTLSGAAQGEVARVWLFLTPFPVVAAAAALTRPERDPQRAAPGGTGGMDMRRPAAILALLALQLLAFNAVLRVVTTGVTDPPTRTLAFAVPGSLPNPIYAELEEQLALLGFALDADGPVQPGATLTLMLTKQALGPIPHSYTVFTHLLSPTGDLVAQHDSLPQQGHLPTPCWLPGEVLTDSYTLVIPHDATPGPYRLTAGLYHYETGERLPLRGEWVTADLAVELGIIDVVEAE